MKKSLPLHLYLLLALVSAVLLSSFLSAWGIALLYTVSSLIKEVLEAILPVMIFFFISSGITSFRQSSVALLGIIFATVFVSNSVASVSSYGVAQLLLPFFKGVMPCALPDQTPISPLYQLKLPKLLLAEQALVLALAIGIVLSLARYRPLLSFLSAGRATIECFLNRVFIPLLPLYILGFFVKISYELPFAQLCSVYGVVFFIIILVQLLYLIGFYILSYSHRAYDAFMTAIPSYLTAMGTMSSVAALPVSLQTAHENTGNKALADVCMPIFANIHLTGDAISVPIFCLVTMQLFLHTPPLFSEYLIFVGYFCVSMLAVSGIPGGGILVMIPILQSLFGFTDEMISVMTALYLLQDSFGTAANVMGDGALVNMINTIGKKVSLIK